MATSIVFHLVTSTTSNFYLYPGYRTSFAWTLFGSSITFLTPNSKEKNVDYREPFSKTYAHAINFSYKNTVL